MIYVPFIAVAVAIIAVIGCAIWAEASSRLDRDPPRTACHHPAHRSGADGACLACAAEDCPHLYRPFGAAAIQRCEFYGDRQASS